MLFPYDSFQDSLNMGFAANRCDKRRDWLTGIPVAVERGNK